MPSVPCTSVGKTTTAETDPTMAEISFSPESTSLPMNQSSVASVSKNRKRKKSLPCPDQDDDNSAKVKISIHLDTSDNGNKITVSGSGVDAAAAVEDEEGETKDLEFHTDDIIVSSPYSSSHSTSSPSSLEISPGSPSPPFSPFSPINLEGGSQIEQEKETFVPTPPPLIAIESVNLSEPPSNSDSEDDAPNIVIRSDLFEDETDHRLKNVMRKFKAKWMKPLTSKIFSAISDLQTALKMNTAQNAQALRKQLEGFRQLQTITLESILVLDAVNMQIETEDVLRFNIPEKYDFDAIERLAIEDMADYFLKIMVLRFFLAMPMPLPACDNWRICLQTLHYRLSRILNLYVVGESLTETEGNFQNILMVIRPRISPYGISIEHIGTTWDRVRTFHILSSMDKRCALFDQSQVGLVGFSQQIYSIVCRLRETIFRMGNIVPLTPPPGSESMKYSFEDNMHILHEIGARTRGVVVPSGGNHSVRIQNNQNFGVPRMVPPNGHGRIFMTPSSVINPNARWRARPPPHVNFQQFPPGARTLQYYGPRNMPPAYRQQQQQQHYVANNVPNSSINLAMNFNPVIHHRPQIGDTLPHGSHHCPQCRHP